MPRPMNFPSTCFARAGRAMRGTLAGLALAALPLVGSADTASDATTRDQMAQVYQAMQVLFPLSVDADAFRDPENQVQIRAALAQLAAASEGLAEHGAEGPASFAYLSHALANDARDIRDRHGAGHTQEARFLVQTLAETCVACHSRLPADRDAPRSQDFVDQGRLASLPTPARARLAYATRQFERAQQLFEALLVDPRSQPTDLDLEGILDDYLELAVRVRRNPERARARLAVFAERHDMPEKLRRDVEGWRRDLETTAKRPAPKHPLVLARSLVEDAEGRVRTGRERSALVPYLEASGWLLRALELESTLSRQERAEAYALLGTIETRIGRSFWLSQAEAYLEVAIRSWPHSRVAEDAFATLNDYLVGGYSGSSGTHLPPDIAAKLDELAGLAMRPEPAATP
ncbi:MAG: hypothetical protein AAF430_07910 [Myxococcota bacterium]